MTGRPRVGTDVWMQAWAHGWRTFAGVHGWRVFPAKDLALGAVGPLAGDALEKTMDRVGRATDGVGRTGAFAAGVKAFAAAVRARRLPAARGFAWTAFARAAFALGAGVVLLPVGHAFAQQSLTHASIAGRVIDPSGAAVPHAAVIAVQPATNQRYAATTDAQGRFRLALLPVGEYRVSAQAAGFAEAVQRVDAGVGSAFEVTLRLSLAETAESVQVSAATAVVETDRSEIAETVQTAEAQDLPFEGRNYLDLALLLPGVSQTNTASTQTLAETAEVVGQGYSVNSQRNFSNSFVVDGLSDNDDAAGVAGNVLSMDAIREFQVVTAGGQAEFGRALGGYFNIVTRSGTNATHGTAYGFLRSQRMNAENALSQTRLPLTQGEYGASLSGPVQRDRTFLFGNFEEQRLRTEGVTTVAPANAATIDARLEATGYAAPMLPVGTGATSTYPTTLHTDTAFARGDRTLSERDRLTARYSLYRLSSLNARGVGGYNEPSNGTSVYDTNHTFAASNSAALTANVYNETRGQFIYDDLEAPPNDAMGPAVTIAGVAIFGRSTSSPTRRLNYLGEAVDNVAVQRGAHSLKAGADVLVNDDTITFPQALRGAYTFSSLANFLAGTYNNGGFTQNFGEPTIGQMNESVGMYAQDEWRATRGLTLNLGVRYDLDLLDTIDTDGRNVSPRVGFAWAPYGDGGTVVRGSYGLFYDRIPLRPLANALLSANNTTDYAQARLLSYTYSPGQAGAPAFPQVAAAPPAGALENFTTMQRKIANAYAQQTSLGVEQQIGRRGSLGLSYQHVRGEHLIGSYNTNISTTGSRPDATRGNVKQYSSAFDSYFDGLEASFVERPEAWGSARISYAWSHAIDDVGEFFFSSPIDNFDFAVDRSRSDDDQRQRVTFDAELTSPTREAKSVGGRLTHGWRLSGILQYTSRLPFNVTTGGSTLQQTTQRPCAPGTGLSVTPGAGSTATPVNACTEGLRGAVIGRNAGIGFDFFTLNARLSRSFALPGRARLETLAEAFNSLNHRNDMIPNGTWGTGRYPTQANTSFGQATAVGDPRSVQIGARISF